VTRRMLPSPRVAAVASGGASAAVRRLGTTLGRPNAACPRGSLRFRAAALPSISALARSLSGASLGGPAAAAIFPADGPGRMMSSVPATRSDGDRTQLGEPITFLTLSNLSDNPGAVTRKRRVGRGIGSSKGKTCGRGHKGQKARAGRGVHPTFEGGQTRLFKRLPKIDKMKNARFRLDLVPLNVGKVQDYLTMGRLRPSRSDGTLTAVDFVNAGMFPASSVKSGIKLLGEGREHVKDRMLIEVSFASASAIEAVERAGGYVTTVHYNRLAMRANLKPGKFPERPGSAPGEEGGGDGVALDAEDRYFLPMRARPPPKYMPYYTDYSKRGYLNPRVQLERRKLGLKEIH